MKRWWTFVGVLVIVAAGVAAIVRAWPADKQTNQVRSSGMELTSTAFANNEAIPPKYTCQGAGVNPPLLILGVPPKAKSLALVVDDPDAPGGTFDHWVVWNLPADTESVPEAWTPEAGAVVGANGAGKSAWYPPCPPSGTHHYHFMLYALDRKLGLAADADKAALMRAMGGQVVAQAELVGTYQKH